MSVEHATFAIERRYAASPVRVFAAWADPATKERWFGSTTTEFELDFRVGGSELHRGVGPDGRPYALRAIFHDIVEPERIVYSYEMLIRDSRISVSLTTVALARDGDGTRLVLTEQGAYLDGADGPHRRQHGMGAVLNALGAELS